jgi:hypothetical protein
LNIKQKGIMTFLLPGEVLPPEKKRKEKKRWVPHAE